MDASSSGANLLRGVVASAASANSSFLVKPAGRSSAAQSNEEQFRSAFEIADTIGDGVLSYQEALEVSTALFPLPRDDAGE